MAIYTRTGDSGITSLFGGKRLLKCEELVDVYGSLDELNSWIGFIKAQLVTRDVQKFLNLIQVDLLGIGSSLAGWPGLKEELLTKRVIEMEARIDMMAEALPEIKNFLLPGGAPLGALIHTVRAICRRVERQTVALAQKQKVEPIILQYLNRLSDFLFVLARFINNAEKAPEISWSGKNR